MRPPDAVQAQGASLVLHNARVLTMDPGRPTAQAVAVSGDRILAVGCNAQICALAGRRAAKIDCRGRWLTPGFIDAHAHILAQASRLQMVDCGRAGSIEELIGIIRTAATGLPKGQWLRAFGYHEAVLREGRHPSRSDLDRAAPDRPVRLAHISGHASVLNSTALATLGIDARAEAPGATIDRAVGSGEPTGLLLEMEDLLERAMPLSSRIAPTEMELLVQRLSNRLLADGVTSVQDLGHRNDAHRASFFSHLVATGRFRPRITMASGYTAFARGEETAAAGIARGPVKIVLNESGADLMPGARELAQQASAVHRSGRQIAIHAIEPSAITAALDAIELAQASDGVLRRHRIEHASITAAVTTARIAALGVAVVSNPAFLWQSGDRYLTTVPEHQLSQLYDAAGLRRAGVLVAAGSDCPVAPPEPAIGIAAACGRRTAGGKAVPGSRLDPAAAIELFTSAAAASAWEEADKGRVAAGLLADLVVLEGGLEAPHVCMTVLGGKIVWKAPDLERSNMPQVETHAD